MFLAVRHLHCKSKSSCGEMTCTGSNGNTAIHGGCVSSTLSCGTVVLKHCDEASSSDRLFSAVISGCVDISTSSPLISHLSSVSSCTPGDSSLVDKVPESPVSLERNSVNAVCENDQLAVESSRLIKPAPPCDRLSDIHISEDNTANSTISNVSALTTETRTNGSSEDRCNVDISSQLVSCLKDASVVKDVNSFPVDGVSMLTSVLDVRPQNCIGPHEQLSEMNGIHVEAQNTVLDINSSCSILEKHYMPVCVNSSDTSLCYLQDCVFPNDTMTAMSSPNGLSAVGHIVSCFKSMTALAKSQNTAHHNG